MDEEELLQYLEARDQARNDREESALRPPQDPSRVYSQGTNVPADSVQDPGREAADEVPVRRPGYGIIPMNPNYARLEVMVLNSDQPVEIFNSSYDGGLGPATTNFILQGMRWAPQEAVRIVQSYGDFYLSDVGENPDILLCNGVLLEAKNFPWFREWMHNWEHFLRARRCILNRAEVHLTIDEITWRGYLINCEVQRSHSFQSSWNMMPMSFQMVLRGVEDHTSEGIQVGPFADNVPTEPPVVTFYREQLLKSDDLSFAAAAFSAMSAFGLELKEGTNNDALRWLEPELEYPEKDVEVEYSLQINRLTAIAAALNRQAGRQIYNLGEVRRGLISLQNSAMAARGGNSPYGDPGNQTAYQKRAQRQAERTQRSIARRGPRAAASLVTW